MAETEIKNYEKPCPKCGQPMRGILKTNATETEPEKQEAFCGNYPTCYSGW